MGACAKVGNNKVVLGLKGTGRFNYCSWLGLGYEFQRKAVHTMISWLHLVNYRTFEEIDNPLDGLARGVRSF